MVLVEYRMQLLNMGTATCIAIGSGGIVMGGCAVSGFRIGIVIPRQCFKFGLGDKAFLEDGSPVFIVKIRSEHGINFYRIDKHGRFFELPESSLLTLSEFIEFTGLNTTNLEQKLEDLLNKPSLSDPPAGSKKVSGTPTFDISAAEMLKEKFLNQIQKLADIVHIPTPSSGKIFFPIEDQDSALLEDALAAKEKLLEEVDILNDCVDSVEPTEAVEPVKSFKFGLGDKAFLSDGTPVFIVKIRSEHDINVYRVDKHGRFFDLPESSLFTLFEITELAGQDKESADQSLEDLLSKPALPDPISGSKKVPSIPMFDISESEALKEKLLKQTQKLSDIISIPPVSPGKILVVEDQDAILLEDALAAKEKLLEEIDILVDCIASIPPDFIVPGPEGVHITEMTGGIKMNGCAFYVPPPGHCC